MFPEANKPPEVFISYAHEDQNLRDELNNHLSNLKRQGVISVWYDRDISAGTKWKEAIQKHLNSAKIILFLISPDFMDSDYVKDAEVKLAMERHEAGETRVVPIILRPVDWGNSPFGNLQALPSNAKPITLWKNIDDAFLDISRGIRKTVRQLTGESHLHRTQNIPTSLAVGFVSRRDSDGLDILAGLKQRLLSSKDHVFAIWGAGGVGKTTLASEVARSLAEESTKRVIWIAADGASFSFSGMLDEIASQIGHPDLRPLSVDLKEQQISSLVSAAPTVLVLDNFETIVRKEQNRVLDFFRRNHSAALITTRERIDSVELIPLASMTPDEGEEYLARLITQTRQPELFEAVSRNAVLTTAEFNPLIIRWIVGQIDLAENPEEVLADLAHGEGDAVGRVFDRSYNLPQLSDGGRALLLALSLFVPSATRPAVADVAGMGKEKDRKRFKKAQQTLESLWLIKQTDDGRLSIDGVTRQLARAHLLKDPRHKSFRERYTVRFLRYAESHSTTTVQDLALLELERDNILNAVDLAFEAREWSKVIDIYSALEKFLEIRGYWDDLIRRGEQAIAAARATNDPLAGARFSGNSATVLMRRGEYRKAREIYEQALEDFKRSNSSTGIASTLHQLGVLAQAIGDLHEAQKLYEESMAINQQLGDTSRIASTLHQLGMLAQERANYADARRFYDESLNIKKRLGDSSGIASTLHQLGVLAQHNKDFTEAKRLYAESLQIKRELGDQSSIASILHNFGMIAQGNGDFDEAEHFYNESLQIETSLGNQSGIATTLSQLGTIAKDRRHFEEAQRLYQESLDINRKLGDRRSAAVNLWQIGLLAHDVGDDHRAFRSLAQAYFVFAELRNPLADKTLDNILTILPRVNVQDFRHYVQSQTSATNAERFLKKINLEYKHRQAEELMHVGKWREALEGLEENKIEFKRESDKFGFAKTLLALAQAEQSIGDLERARWTYKDALDQFRDLDKSYVALTCVYLGRLELQTGFVRDALFHLEEAERYFSKVDDEDNLKRVRELLDAAKELAAKEADDEAWAKSLLDSTRTDG
jgi:tetratricopeptide (TPR) repeat protein